MFVGHGLLALAVVVWVAGRLGWSRERVLLVGVVAFVFGTIPDVDMLYAPVGLLGGGFETPQGAARSFWSASEGVHRAVTHSLLFGGVGAVGAAAWARRDTAGRFVATGLGGGLVWLTATVSGGLDALIAVAFVGAVVLTGELAARRGVSPGVVGVVAGVGLLSHPFGDVFTGTPPDFLYPLDVPFIAERVALSSDPTLHLLGAMGVELLTVWLAVAVLASHIGWSLRERVDPWAVTGLVCAAGVLFVPAPTLELSYPFVLGVLGVGVVTATPRLTLSTDPGSVFDAGVTGLAAVTLGAMAYAVAYGILG